MNRLAALLAEFGPTGVEFLPLRKVARIRNGKAYAHLNPGSVPVYGSGGVMTHVDKFAYDKPSVLIPRKGSLGNIFYLDEPFWNVDTIFHTEIDEAVMLPKFLYYVLTTMRLAEMNQAGGVPSQTQAVLNELRLPVPGLAVQTELVRTLDAMEALQSALHEEVVARRRQFEYYRDKLLAFPQLADAEPTA